MASVSGLFGNLPGLGSWHWKGLGTAQKWYATGRRTLEDVKNRKGGIKVSDVQEVVGRTSSPLINSITRHFYSSSSGSNITTVCDSNRYYEAILKAVPDIWKTTAEKYGDRVALVDPYHEPPSKLTYKEVRYISFLPSSEKLQKIFISVICLYIFNDSTQNIPCITFSY